MKELVAVEEPDERLSTEKSLDVRMFQPVDEEDGRRAVDLILMAKFISVNSDNGTKNMLRCWSSINFGSKIRKEPNQIFRLELMHIVRGKIPLENN